MLEKIGGRYENKELIGMVLFVCFPWIRGLRQKPWPVFRAKSDGE